MNSTQTKQATRRNFLKMTATFAAVGVLSQSRTQTAIAADGTEVKNSNYADVAKNIGALRNNKLSCSQSTFVGLCTTLGSPLSEEQLYALSAGFAGGIGRTYANGTCGALVAGVMTLGLYLPQQTDNAIASSKELFELFETREGSVICKDLLKKHGGFSNCTNCCLHVARDVVRILQKNG